MSLSYTSHRTPIKLRHDTHEDVGAIIALLADQRGQLKIAAKFCRQVERSRHYSERDKRHAARLRHMISGMLSLARVGGRS